MRLGKRVLSWCVCAALMMGAGCDGCSDQVGPDEEEEEEDEHLAFNVTMHNLDGNTPVHLFALSETFPCCSVLGGDNRTVALSNVSPGTNITFSVGRNGSVLKTMTCKAEDDVGGKQVRWTPTANGANTGTLQCFGW